MPFLEIVAHAQQCIIERFRDNQRALLGPDLVEQRLLFRALFPLDLRVVLGPGLIPLFHLPATPARSVCAVRQLSC